MSGRLGRFGLPLGAAGALALVVTGVALARPTSKPEAGRVPATRLPAADPTVSTSPSWRPEAARTLAPAGTSITPQAHPSAPPASAAGNPIGNNPVPIRLVQLDIPALRVSARVVDVGLARDAQLDIPADPRTLGRWTGGSEPGEPFGSTVVVGHVDTATQNGALFALHTMRLGEQIVAVGADGRRLTYRVVASREIAKAELATALEPFRQDVQARLVIVTCGGRFDPVARHYADNVVVFAVPVAA